MELLHELLMGNSQDEVGTKTLVVTAEAHGEGGERRVFTIYERADEDTSVALICDTQLRQVEWVDAGYKLSKRERPLWHAQAEELARLLGFEVAYDLDGDEKPSADDRRYDSIEKAGVVLDRAQRVLIASAINRISTGGHPVATPENVEGFTRGYARDCVEIALREGKLSEEGERVAEGALALLIVEKVAVGIAIANCDRCGESIGNPDFSICEDCAEQDEEDERRAHQAEREAACGEAMPKRKAVRS